jgi:uncharacterized protein YjiK
MDYIIKYIKPTLFLFVLLIFQNCKNDSSVNPDQSSLSLISEITLNISEPSGLSLGKNNQSLWVVSDAPDSEVFEINLQGDVLRKINFTGDDLEGIAFDSLGNTLWVVEEKLRQIVQLSLNGQVLQRYNVMVDGDPNNGLEGISSSNKNEIWTVNEKNPGLLITFDEDFSNSSRIELLFAQDYSGISCGLQSDVVWIVSDESRQLYQYDKANTSLKTFELLMEKAEGVAVDETTNLVYIVSETENKLFTFKYSE